MRVSTGVWLASVILLFSPGRAFAHHSFQAEFDATKRTQFVGIVTKVEWSNPHARFYLDVKDPGGAVTNWNFELGSPLQLHRQGWRSDSLKVGDQVTVEGYPAKDGSKMASARKITLADGSTVFSGTSTNGSPAQ
jgi:hypothetical protein